MPLDRSILTNDIRQVCKDLPVSFRFRGKTYTDGSFSPGQNGYDTVTGGIVEDVGTATLVYAVEDLADFRKEPEMDEALSVFWQGKWRQYEVSTYVAGFALATFTLKSPNKG